MTIQASVERLTKSNSASNPIVTLVSSLHEQATVDEITCKWLEPIINNLIRFASKNNKYAYTRTQIHAMNQEKIPFQ
jgi:hypothetical protein